MAEKVRHGAFYFDRSGKLTDYERKVWAPKPEELLHLRNKYTPILLENDPIYRFGKDIARKEKEIFDSMAHMKQGLFMSFEEVQFCDITQSVNEVTQLCNSLGLEFITRDPLEVYLMPNSISMDIDPNRKSKLFNEYGCSQTITFYPGSHAEVKKLCDYCLKHNEPRHIYESHDLKNKEGKIICPRLNKYKCKICRSNGESSHTRSYCPLNGDDSDPSFLRWIAGYPINKK